MRPRVVTDAAGLADAGRVILPGVGAAPEAMRRLRAQGLVEPLRALQAPLLGICLGMQLLYERSEEGEVECLGLLSGVVHRLPPAPGIRVPHMGWNDVSPTPHRDGATLIEPGEAYFLHSYHFRPENGRDVAAMTDHGGGLVAAVARDNIVGVQFHPEKSQAYGLALLARFLEWNP